MTARRERHYGDGWPYSCRSSACFWCRRAMIRGWWEGIRYWASATTSSLAIIPTLSSFGFPDAVRRLRRGLRDVRDRTARRWRQWRTVAVAGLMGGDHIAMVMVSHHGIDRREVLNVLCRRWPDVVVKGSAQEEPTWAMMADDAAALGSRRRSVEPLRITVMRQKVQRVTVAPALEIAPTPILV
jgi:AcrR family transcriptional regulator